MIHPFLEISIEKTTEKKISEKILVEKIQQAFLKIYNKESKIVYYNEKPFLRIEFESRDAFEKIYERSYSFYVFIFEHFLKQNPDFSEIFNENLENINPNKENYIVLRYRTNQVDIIHRYLGFTTRVYKMFGSKIINEEIYGGYLRFLFTKEDFEALLTPGDAVESWKQNFKIRHVDISHPKIQEFFTFVEKWENSYNINKQ
ncbi:MAG: hypothetical protein ACTSVU_07445 [Promethearchaeota archaeon]